MSWSEIHNNLWRKHQLWSEFWSKLGWISLTEGSTRIQQYLDKSYKKESDVKSHQIIKLAKKETRGIKVQLHYAPVKIIIKISKRQQTPSE